jgi:hypothetical protein
MPRPRLHHDAHLAAVKRGEGGLNEKAARESGDVDKVAMEIAASAQKFAEAYDEDEKAEERQEDLAGQLREKTQVKGEKEKDS